MFIYYADFMSCIGAWADEYGLQVWVRTKICTISAKYCTSDYLMMAGRINPWGSPLARYGVGWIVFIGLLQYMLT